MKELVWDRSLSVEVEEIDADHRRLVELFNLLVRAVAEGEADDYVAALLEELVSCTAWHFRHEERLMLRHAYPERDVHAQEHEALIAAARALQQRFRESGERLTEEAVVYLESWLAEHILVADMRLGAHLANVM
ncbi:MAG: bacteriohemerythrin [Gammaproteobacteria bacterium]|nr:bacteriohemerythrin [Gammaproteobacteria bacterium]